MKKFIAIFGILLGVTAIAADVKISQLTLGTAATTTSLDSFPYVAAATNVTKRLGIWDLSNVPSIVSTYATKLNPVFTGTISGGALAVTGQIASSKASSPTLSNTNASLKLYDATLGTGLFGGQISGSPFPFQLQVSNSAFSSFFPMAINPLGGDLSIGTPTTGLINKEHVAIYSPYTTDTTNTTGLTNQMRLTTNTSVGNTYRAFRSETVRTITAPTADNGGFYGGTFGLSIENGTNNWSNVSPIATLQIHEIKGYGAGTLAAPFTGIFVTPEPAVMTGRKGGIYVGAPTNGSLGNAFIHDNWTWSGNWFINSSSTSPSTFNGAVGIGVTSTPAAKLDVLTTGTVAHFATSGANDAVMILDNAAGGNATRIALQDAGDSKFRIKKYANNSFAIEDTVHAARDAFFIETGGSVDLLPAGVGNVGIGKSAPATALDVNGTVTATAFAGPLTGNVVGNVTGSAGTFTGNLTGDVTSTAMATTVSKIQTVTVSGVSGTGNVAFTASPTFTGTVTTTDTTATTSVNAGIWTIRNNVTATAITGATTGGGTTGGGTANFALGSSSVDGMLLISNTSTGATALYMISGGSAIVASVSDPSAKFSPTPTTASKDNISISTTNLVIEHNSNTSSNNFRVTFLKI